MEFSRNVEVLKLTAERLGVEDLRKVTAQPGVNETLRVSIHYPDGRQPDSIATLKRGTGAACHLSLVYDRYDRAMQLFRYEFDIPVARYHQLLAALRQNKFDGMDDEPDMPTGLELWLLERGSGTFYHDVLLTPAQASGHHREVVLAIRKLLPEAVRELAT